jgi:hypothetical protein
LRFRDRGTVSGTVFASDGVLRTARTFPDQVRASWAAAFSDNAGRRFGAA